MISKNSLVSYLRGWCEDLETFKTVAPMLCITREGKVDFKTRKVSLEMDWGGAY